MGVMAMTAMRIGKTTARRVREVLRAGCPVAVVRRAVDSAISELWESYCGDAGIVSVGHALRKRDQRRVGDGPVVDEEHGQLVWADGSTTPMSESWMRAREWERGVLADPAMRPDPALTWDGHDHSGAIGA